MAFKVAEQRSGDYIIHIFASEERFKEWRQQHQGKNIIHPTNVKGRMLDVEDHRSDWLYENLPQRGDLSERR